MTSVGRLLHLSYKSQMKGSLCWRPVWITSLVETLLSCLMISFPDLPLLISKIHVNFLKEDKLIWFRSDSGEISLNDAYNQFIVHGCGSDWGKIIWHSWIPYSQSVLFWDWPKVVCQLMKSFVSVACTYLHFVVYAIGKRKLILIFFSVHLFIVGLTLVE